MTTLHEAARRYAEAGWPIFPIRPLSKTPLYNRSFYNATTDLTIIDAWWQETPDANIGLEPERIGMGVIDVDPSAEVATGDHPRRALTPRGGCHDYYAGSLPGTQSKVADHVDTRGRSSYVLLPPSRVVDIEKGINGAYTWQCDWPFHDFDCPSVPEWIVEKCKPRVEEHRKADEYVEDKPEAIRLARLYLDLCVPMDADNPSQDDYAVACRLLDYGLSCDTAVRLAVERGADPDWAFEKLDHAARYRQNEEGCDVPLSTKEAFAPFAETLSQSSPAPEEGSAFKRFAWHPPTEYRDRPPLEWYDEDHMLPHEARGTVGVVYGASGHHKTNTLLTMMVQAALDHDILVLYVAGEGVDGFGRDRVWAHAKARGLDAEWIDKHLAIVETMPWLADQEDVAAFFADAEPFVAKHGKPDIVILDTLGTGTPGIDENAKAMGDILSGNGACGAIRRHWGCTVIAVSHSGKDESRGLRGHSSQRGNIDFELHIVNVGRAIQVTCEKMRDGKQGAEAYYRVEPQGVPVPKKITQGEWRDLTRTQPEDMQGTVERIIWFILRELEAYGWANGVSSDALLDAWMIREHGECPGQLGDLEYAQWQDTYKANKEALRKGKTKKWGATLYEERLPLGVDHTGQREGRWRIPTSE